MDNYIVSARKYRPMTFGSVVGQESLTTTLKNAVKNQKLAHAYLFCGPRGVGKTTCARIFAKTINCSHITEEGEACNECESCKSFNEGRSMNIFELDAASNNSVENMRQLLEQIQIPPQTGKYKVFIIDEVHMLSTSAFNAFLKTLEEPPKYIIFILATTEKHKILPTIISRCQIYDFERMAVPEIIDHLKMVAEREGIKYDEESLSIIAEKADGGMRDALSIFDQVASYCEGNISYEKVLEDLNMLDIDQYFRIVDMALANDASNIMLLLNGLIANGFDAGNVVNGLASHIRNVMMASNPQTLSLLDVSEKNREKYQEQAKKCPPRFLYRALKIINECDVNYRYSSNKRLLAELTLIRVAQITQPEAEDAEGAGRSPKSLKILFSNIKHVRPQKVQQVTEADRVEEASSAQSYNKSSKQDEAPQPSAMTAAPQAQNTTSGAAPKRIKLKGVGTTFEHLRRGENPTDNVTIQKTEETNNADHAKKFTEPELSMQWTLMCNRMPKEYTGLASRLKNLTPRIAEYPDIEITFDNEILLSQAEEIKGKLCATMRSTLGNPNINLHLKLAEKDSIRRLFTKREIFDEMRKNNPAVEKLRQQLGLELA